MKLILGLLLLALSVDAQTTPRYVKTSQTCVTNAAGGTILTTTLSSTHQPRLALEVQNTGPNVIWCIFGVLTPVAGSGASRKVASNDRWGVDVYNLPSDTTARITCIAETAAQASPACTQLTEAFAK